MKPPYQMTPAELLESGWGRHQIELHFGVRDSYEPKKYVAITITRQDWDSWKAGNQVSLIQRASHGDKPIEAPHCPEHKTRMRYDAQKERFVCGEVECKRTARLKVTAENLKDTVLSGDIELIRQDIGEGTKWFLHLIQQRVMVDITDSVDPDATGERHGMNGAWMVGLMFPSGVRDITE